MKTIKKFTALLTLLLAFSLPLSAYAASWQNFTDISGHWAESAMKTGYDEGLITGTGATTLAPDAPITSAQMAAILCRVLGASETADISSLGISSDAWYYKTAGEAMRLGLFSDHPGNLDMPATRQDAFTMMAKAFCIVPAEPDYSALGSYADASLISSGNKAAMASLISAKYVCGSGGYLNVNGKITRAEFLTVLFRIAKNYTSADVLKSGTDGAVVRGSGSLSYINAGNIWFDCSSSNVTISASTANSITLRGNDLTSLSISNGSSISTLAINVGSGSVCIGSSKESQIGTLRLESCGNASIDTAAESIQLTGNNIPVSISGKHKDLIITGTGNTVSLSSDTSFERIKITGSNNNIVTGSDKGILSCGKLEISGQGNDVSFNMSSTDPSSIILGGTGNKLGIASGTISSLSVEGTKDSAELSALSSVGSLSVSGSGNRAVVSAASCFPVNVSGSLNVVSVDSSSKLSDISIAGSSNWTSFSCSGLSSVIISGEYNTLIKAGSGNTGSVQMPGSGNAFILNKGNILATAELKGSGNKITIDGTANTITVDGQQSTLDGSGKAQSLTINALGCTVNLPADSVIDNSKKDVEQENEQRVLDLITSDYQGNYTLKWAQEHDYDDSDKVTWVNAKGYSSSTDYLIWVNLSMQRVNIFQGSAGNWQLCYSCIVGTGAPGLGTPVGTWTVTYKLLAGWTTDTYTVKPVVGFKQDTGYAFHSRLFFPGTSRLSDSSIGYPISHGCVRMYDEDVNYIYSTIPFGTTVVVY